jgi:hypothetical protein
MLQNAIFYIKCGLNIGVVFKELRQTSPPPPEHIYKYVYIYIYSSLAIIISNCSGSSFENYVEMSTNG